MEKLATSIPDLLLVKPTVWSDERGFFIERYHQKKWQQWGLTTRFVQDNHSHSVQHVLRGLHYQTQYAQGKLVTVVSGRIFDVAVDIRPDSPYFGQWFGTELSSTNHHQLYIPPGFAHGFLVLSETADVIYKTTDYYTPAYEQTICWNDPDINIQWPLQAPPILSEKDEKGLTLTQAIALL